MAETKEFRLDLNTACLAHGVSTHSWLESSELASRTATGHAASSSVVNEEIWLVGSRKQTERGSDSSKTKTASRNRSCYARSWKRVLLSCSHVGYFLLAWRGFYLSELGPSPLERFRFGDQW